MRPFRVPGPHRAPIRQIADLDDAEFSALIVAISSEQKNIARAYFVSLISDALGTENHDAVSTLLDALLGAHSVLQRRQAPPQAIADAIADDPQMKLDESEKALLSSRLAILLSLEQLATLSRAARLLLEDDQTFCSARTLSDLRPVFVAGSDPPEAVGTVIRHTLAFRYHTDGPETEPFFMSIDKSGLRALRDAVDRALAKDEVLRKMAESSGLRIVDVEDSH